MSEEMYNFILCNIDRLRYDLINGLIITPKGTNGTFCSSTGYLRVKVNKKSLQVHQVLSVMYYDEKCIGMTVNHKDGNKLNNRRSNLELLSLKDNVKHAHKSGLCRYSKGESIGVSVLTESQVIKIREKLEKGLSQRKIAKEYSVSKGTIQGIKERKIWKHI